jgi:hypothetical protein
MPFYLEEADVIPQTAGLRSVLIVPCRFCPAVSRSVTEATPYIELLRTGLRTAVYESFIQDLERRLQKEGIRTAVFDSRLPHQFVACMWTARRRRELARRAAEFEGALVLGCDAHVEMVQRALESTGCTVIRGMEVQGIMNVLPTLDFPCNITLEMQSVTPVMTRASHEASG